MSDLYAWRDQAQFMRETGAVYAEWDPSGEVLMKLQLAPIAVAPAARPPGPAQQMASRHFANMNTDQNAGLQAQAAEERAQQSRHNIMFAASRVKPRMDRPEPPESAVPRAVRAKQAAAAGGSTKRKK